jgi:hypothetical protein
MTSLALETFFVTSEYKVCLVPVVLAVCLVTVEQEICFMPLAWNIFIVILFYAKVGVSYCPEERNRFTFQNVVFSSFQNTG